MREQYLKELAGRCQISEEAMARVLQAGPRSAADSRPGGNRSAGQGPRKVANEPDGYDKGAYANYGDPGGDYGYGEPNSSYGPQGTAYGAEKASGFGTDSARRRSGNDRGYSSGNRSGSASNNSARASSSGRASSVSTQLMAAERARRAEREALRWVLADPGAVLAWLDRSFFADPMHRSAFALATRFGDIRAASDRLDSQVEADFEPDSDEERQFLLDRAALHLLHELAVEAPVSTAEDTIALLVGNAGTRAVAAMSMAHANPDSSVDPGSVQAIGPLKMLLQELHDPRKRAEVLGHLVPWLSAWSHQQSQATTPTP